MSHKVGDKEGNQTKQPFELIIFDWDGTVMDSTERIVNCFQNAARDCQQPIPARAAVEASIGLSLHEAWRGIAPNAKAAVIEAMTESYRDHFITIDQTPMPLYDGALDGLLALKKTGQWLAIATGKSRRGMQRVFSECDIEHLFVASRCGDETHSKPNPQMLFDVLEVTGMEVSQAVMVGDTLFDMHMAEQAGMASLAVSYGVGDAAELGELATLGAVDSFAQIVEKLIAPNE